MATPSACCGSRPSRGRGARNKHAACGKERILMPQHSFVKEFARPSGDMAARSRRFAPTIWQPFRSPRCEKNLPRAIGNRSTK